MVKSKQLHSPEVKFSNKLTYEHKIKTPKIKRYIGKKTRTKTQGLELDAKNDFKSHCNDLEVYIFELGPRALNKFTRNMKELKRYLRETYSNSYQPKIMTETPSTFPEPDIAKIIPDKG